MLSTIFTYLLELDLETEKRRGDFKFHVLLFLGGGGGGRGGEEKEEQFGCFHHFLIPSHSYRAVLQLFCRFDDLCFELVQNNFECVIRPEITLCG